ncbi:hypothetical protein EAE99_010605 [Botrytis elliptica]|nr:hypothetical protein EAE99_010605 [Botrytis elliptica]
MYVKTISLTLDSHAILTDVNLQMSEGIKNPRINVSRAMIASIMINSVLAFGMLIATVFCAGDLTAAFESPTGHSFIEIFTQAVGSVTGATAMASILVFVSFSGTLGTVAAASRQVWGFSRDRGVPFWSSIGRINPRTSVPLAAVFHNFESRYSHDTVFRYIPIHFIVYLSLTNYQRRYLEALMRLAKRADEKSVELQYLVNISVPNRIIGDSIRLCQVIIKLIGNAIKFADQGEVKFTAQIAKHDPATAEKQALEVVVSDNGIKIQKGYLDLIFDTSWQEMVHHIGNVAIQSSAYLSTKTLQSKWEETSGWRVGMARRPRFSLRACCGALSPMKAPSRSSSNRTMAPAYSPLIKDGQDPFTLSPALDLQIEYFIQPLKPPVPTEHLSSLAIPLAEDNAINQKLSRKVLERYTHVVTVVENGLAAFRAIRANKYDILLMEIKMPVMGGFEATVKIREYEQSQDLRRIPITALPLAIQEEEEECIKIRMDDCLSEPTFSRHLIKMVSKYVRYKDVASLS